MSMQGLYDSQNFDPVEEHFKDIGSYILDNHPKGGVLSFPSPNEPLTESERTLP